MKKKNIIITSLIAVAVVAVALIFKPSRVNVEDIQIETAKVESGTISQVVTATGTLEALTTVEVGTQVSGIVEDLFVDFNSYVKKGQLLAKIDTTNLAAALEQSRASLDNAKAELDYQQATFNRLVPLNDKQLISQTDYDQTLYNLNKAKASYKSAKAQYKKNEINLAYAFIYSPIDGIVLNRSVEEGQTVAASFNTPTLFTIANDLTQMQVEANIDEADIGQVKKGQRVAFTVDAYPDVLFDGEVTQVRLEPTVTNNVVTYTIIISAPNPDFKLMPGMTAETEIYVVEKKDILVLPSKAARFSPDQSIMASYMADAPKPEMPPMQEGMEMPPHAANTNIDDNHKMLWVKEGTSIHPVPVTTGLDDDIHIEIIEGLDAGDEIVLSMETEGVEEEAPEQAGGNPFMPKPPGPKK